jgi:hypothetical protein
LSPEAQQIARVLSSLPERMRDPAARLEVRGFLRACEAAGVDIIGVDRARALLATFEGEIGGDGKAMHVVSLPVTTPSATTPSARRTSTAEQLEAAPVERTHAAVTRTEAVT